MLFRMENGKTMKNYWSGKCRGGREFFFISFGVVTWMDSNVTFLKEKKRQGAGVGEINGLEKINYYPKHQNNMYHKGYLTHSSGNYRSRG